MCNCDTENHGNLKVVPSGIYTLTLFRGIIFESLCYVYPSVPRSGERLSCSRYMNRCKEKVTFGGKLSSCFSLPTSSLYDQVFRKPLWWPEPGGFLPPHAVTTEFRSPSMLLPVLQGAALQQRLPDTWRRWWLQELLEATQEGRGKQRQLVHCALSFSSAPCIDFFLSMEAQLARQHWLLLPPHTPVFKDALVGVACMEKQLLWEWLIISDGKRKGKYLSVINAR